MHDHDQRFKNLIREFFGDFLRLFFNDWAERLDCDNVEWLDKEVFPDPPDGTRSVLDLVAKLPTRQTPPGTDPTLPDTWIALVHIEIESPDKVAPLRPRMFRYYVGLREKYQLPVLPIGVYLKVGLNGIGVDVYEERFWELETVRFQYLYVGLPALDAVKYVHGDNYLGVALTALMSIPKDRIAALGLEALERIQSASLTDQKRYLLAECVQAYLPIDEVQKAEFKQQLVSGKYAGVQAMNKTWLEEGEEIGRRKALRELMEDKFGQLPANVAQRLEKMELPELIRAFKTTLHAETLADLGFDK